MNIDFHKYCVHWRWVKYTTADLFYETDLDLFLLLKLENVLFWIVFKEIYSVSQDTQGTDARICFTRYCVK